MFDNKWQKKEMPLVSLMGMGGGLTSPGFLSSVVFLGLSKPTILLPENNAGLADFNYTCLLYTSPSPRDRQKSRMPSSA